jgi:hypothetical protein
MWDAGVIPDRAFKGDKPVTQSAERREMCAL